VHQHQSATTVGRLQKADRDPQRGGAEDRLRQNKIADATISTYSDKGFVDAEKRRKIHVRQNRDAESNAAGVAIMDRIKGKTRHQYSSYHDDAWEINDIRISWQYVNENGQDYDYHASDEREPSVAPNEQNHVAQDQE